MKTSAFFTQAELTHVWHLTLAQIKGLTLEQNIISPDAWEWEFEWYRLMNTPLSHLKDEDLKEMLLQRLCVEVIIPMTIKRMEVFFFEERNPHKPDLSKQELDTWDMGLDDYYMQGILWTLIYYEADFWAEHPIELEHLKHIMTRAVRLNLHILTAFTYDKVENISFEDHHILEVLYAVHNLKMIVEGFERHEKWNKGKPYNVSGKIYLSEVLDEFISDLDAFYNRLNEIQFFNEAEIAVIGEVSDFNYVYGKKLQRIKNTASPE